MKKDNYIFKIISNTLLVVVFFVVFIQPLSVVFSDISSELIIDIQENFEESSSGNDFSDEDANEDDDIVLGFLSIGDNYLCFELKLNFNVQQILFKSLIQETLIPPPDLA